MKGRYYCPSDILIDMWYNPSLFVVIPQMDVDKMFVIELEQQMRKSIDAAILSERDNYNGHV